MTKTKNTNEIDALIVAINVGNTRTGVGLFTGRTLEESFIIENGDVDAAVERIVGMVSRAEGQSATPVRIVLGSVNDATADPLLRGVQEATSEKVWRAGKDFEIPIGRCVDREALVGEDRLLNAAAAFDVLRQACVVIDAGTAVTVDFVDGEGTFHGGAIAPGAQMQLNGLHDHTAALPEVRIAAPTPEPFGGNTIQAMLHGVFYGIRGMVRHLIERYAEAYEAYPMIVATGGDAHLLFDGDELIERIDDSLPLRGLAAAVCLALENERQQDSDATDVTDDDVDFDARLN